MLWLHFTPTHWFVMMPFVWQTGQSTAGGAVKGASRSPAEVSCLHILQEGRWDLVWHFWTTSTTYNRNPPHSLLGFPYQKASPFGSVLQSGSTLGIFGPSTLGLYNLTHYMVGESSTSHLTLSPPYIHFVILFPCSNPHRPKLESATKIQLENILLFYSLHSPYWSSWGIFLATCLLGLGVGSKRTEGREKPQQALQTNDSQLPPLNT